MAAATRVIAAQGLGAPTAMIAKEAGVSNGSLFTYFETKADLLNQLYIELKTEMAVAALTGLPVGRGIREQTLHMWTQWLAWATAHPEKRRALAHLSISDEITAENLELGHQTMAGVARLMERGRESGPMRDAPLTFVVALMNGIADATIDFMIRDPAQAKRHSQAAFDALWRMVA
jgi:AcrR family transcriptional regulator